MEAKDKRYYPGSNVKDVKGQTVPFVFNYAKTHPGSQEYTYTEKDQPEGFFIIPIGAGSIKVQLFGQADGESFIINTAETNANVGKVLPYRVKKIFNGTDTTIVSMQLVW